MDVNKNHESREERSARLREEKANANLQRSIQKAEVKLRLRIKGVLIGVLTLTALVINGVCVLVIVREKSSPDMITWATSMLTSTATGIIGYLTGKVDSHEH
ncbi:MAG: hypothetical protein QOH49_4979 [Acidobacteriota bacterium]|jgi:hypothetical protein|nr:hypothetical protein [Acidobacteriota bacterium]